MAYFANGTEGQIFYDRFCCRCKRDADQDCPVWLVHILYNSDGANNENSLLHKMIPEDQLSCHFFKSEEAS